MSYVVSSLDKALTILEVLAKHANIGVSEVAQHTGSTKSQAFRLLYTLEQRGYVRKNATTRSYTLGYKALYLGDLARKQTHIVEIAEPVLDDLAKACEENVHLIVREELSSVCVALRESNLPLRLYAQVGRRGPLHAGGGSTLLLAYAPEDVQNQVLGSELEVFTSTTETDATTLRKTIERIRAQGFHESYDDLDAGAYSVAAPIRNHEGEVVAALSIAGPLSRLTKSRGKQHLDLVIRYASDVSEVLGWKSTEPVRDLARG